MFKVGECKRPHVDHCTLCGQCVKEGIKNQKLLVEKARRYDEIISLTMTDYHEYPVENLPELILRIADGEDIREPFIDSDKLRINSPEETKK